MTTYFFNISENIKKIALRRIGIRAIIDGRRGKLKHKSP